MATHLVTHFTRRETNDGNGCGGSTYKSADGIWHAAIDIEPDRATGRRRRLTAQGKTKAVANARLRMKLDAYVRKGGTRPRWSAR